MEKVERYLIFFLLVRERSLTAFLDRADIRERASLTRSSRIFLNLSYLSFSVSRSFVSLLFHESPILPFVSV